MNLFLILWNTICVYLMVGLFIAMHFCRVGMRNRSRKDQIGFAVFTTFWWLPMIIIATCEWIAEENE